MLLPLLKRRKQGENTSVSLGLAFTSLRQRRQCDVKQRIKHRFDDVHCQTCCTTAIWSIQNTFNIEDRLVGWTHHLIWHFYVRENSWTVLSSTFGVSLSSDICEWIAIQHESNGGCIYARQDILCPQEAYIALQIPPYNQPYSYGDPKQTDLKLNPLCGDYTALSLVHQALHAKIQVVSSHLDEFNLLAKNVMQMHSPTHTLTAFSKYSKSLKWEDEQWLVHN